MNTGCQFWPTIACWAWPIHCSGFEVITHIASSHLINRGYSRLLLHSARPFLHRSSLPWRCLIEWSKLILSYVEGVEGIRNFIFLLLLGGGAGRVGSSTPRQPRLLG